MQGMCAERDPIAMVEACYEQHGSDDEWLANVARCAQPLLKVDDLLAYHIDVTETSVAFRSPVEIGGDGKALARIRAMADLLERRNANKVNTLERAQVKVYEKVIRRGIAQPADHMLLSEMKTYGPRWMYTLGVPRVAELVHLVNHHIDGLGATLLVGPRSKADVLHPAERATYQMLSAHVKAGLRLRRRLGEGLAAVKAPTGGAVLDASMRVVHAEGEAREEPARELLAARAKDVDRARTRASGRDVGALEVW
ncbi:MAG TPA: hypothetical protein VM580_04345, partial [Labilithrix sp.]|nr:hypothetical protein [Labilithrix sp.]